MNAHLQPSRRARVRGYLVLPHAVPIVVVMVATAAFAFVSRRGWPGAPDIGCLLGAMFGAQLAIGAVNELVDADLDAVAKPSKPIPSGLVSRRGARIVAMIGVAMMAAFSLRFDFEAFLLCGLGTVSGLAYSVWFKRTVVSWVPYLVALPLLPIWVWAALGSIPRGLFAIYPIGAAAVIAVQIAQSLPDVEADRASRVRTLAVWLGAARARQFCAGAMVFAALLASVLAAWLTETPWLVWGAALAACGLVSANIVIWKTDARRGDLACFPCIAVSAAVLGIGWTAALNGAGR